MRFYENEFCYFLSKFIPFKSLRRSVKGRLRYKIDHAKVAESLEKNFVKPYLNGELKKWELKPKVDFKDSNIVWQFWYQGVESAPKYTQKCLESVQNQMQRTHKIIILDKNNIKDYLDLPPFVWQKLEREGFAKKPITSFSDLLRVCLLSVYGGVWVDASIFLSAKIPTKILKKDFFAFYRSKIPPSDYKKWVSFDYNYFCWEDDFLVKMLNSFIVANARNPLVCALKDILLSYWEAQDKYGYYFTFQIIFELLKRSGEFGEIVDSSYNDTDLHLLQYFAKSPYSDGLKNEIFKKSFLHKLTHFKELPKDSLLYCVLKD